MTMALIVYGITVSVLLASACYFLDRGLRSLKRPTRWVWVTGSLVAAGAPFASVLLARGPQPLPAQTSLPSEFLYEVVGGMALEPTGLGNLASSIDQWLLPIWLLASGSIFLIGVGTWARLNRAARGWDSETHGSEEVLVSDGLGPAVFGLLRPRIVLPRWTLELTQEKRELILLHEIEHKAARDPATLVWGFLLATLAPWNPALWWMARRLHLAVEGDCDARVLARGVSPKRYGKLLLEVASSSRPLSAFSPALAEGGDTNLERRLLMIRETVRRKSIPAALATMVFSAGFVSLACETPTPPPAVEPDLRIETAPASAAAHTLSGVEAGYHLVRATEDGVEYVRSVDPGELDLVNEDPDNVSLTFLEKEAPVESSRRVVVNEDDSAGLRPLIVVDGVIVSDPSFRESLTPEMIDRIEVIKGPAAAQLYGERAAGGVIKIFTKH